MLADVETGVPELVSELTLTTAIRTARCRQWLHVPWRDNCKTMAIIGNGAQSEFQALAFHHLLGIETFHLYDIDSAATDKLEANLTTHGVKTNVCQHQRSGQRRYHHDCDSGQNQRKPSSPQTLIEPVCTSLVLVATSVKTEIHADVLRIGPVFCEFEPQSRIEGDMQQMPADFQQTELWTVLSGKSLAVAVQIRSRFLTRLVSLWKTVQLCATCAMQRMNWV